MDPAAGPGTQKTRIGLTFHPLRRVPEPRAGNTAGDETASWRNLPLAVPAGYRAEASYGNCFSAGSANFLCHSHRKMPDLDGAQIRGATDIRNLRKMKA